MSQMLSKIILSGAGATFILFVVARLLPNEKLKTWGVNLGKIVSSFGVGKLGRAFWEKIEDFLENSSSVFFGGLKEGLDADDNQDNPPTVEKPAAQ